MLDWVRVCFALLVLQRRQRTRSAWHVVSLVRKEVGYFARRVVVSPCLSPDTELWLGEEVPSHVVRLLLIVLAKIRSLVVTSVATVSARLQDALVVGSRRRDAHSSHIAARTIRSLVVTSGVAGRERLGCNSKNCLLQAALRLLL